MKRNVPTFRSYEHQQEIAKASGGFFPPPSMQDLHGGVGFEWYSPSPQEETAAPRSLMSLREELIMWAGFIKWTTIVIGGIWGIYSLMTYAGSTIRDIQTAHSRANMVPETPDERLERHKAFLKADPFALKK
jgi:hypothetical protein